MNVHLFPLLATQWDKVKLSQVVFITNLLIFCRCITDICDVSYWNRMELGRARNWEIAKNKCMYINKWWVFMLYMYFVKAFDEGPKENEVPL